MALTITSHAPYPRLLTLTLAGELDLASADALRDAVTDAVKSDDVDAILVDLEGLTFLDSTGIGTLVAGWRQASDSAKRLRVDKAHGMTREVLWITGVWPTLTGTDAAGNAADADADEAAAAPGASEQQAAG